MTVFGVPPELLEAIKPTADEVPPSAGPLREAWLLGELEWTLECLHSLAFDDLCTWGDLHRLKLTRALVKRVREEMKQAA